MNAEERQRLAAARLWAANRYPYLAHALFACEIVVVDGLNAISVDDRWRLYIDPYIAREWPVELTGSVIVHHVGHLLREHADRARVLGLGRDEAKDWTLAADAEINDDLVDSGIELPGEPVTPQSLGLEPGRFAEEYFRAIHQDEHTSEPGDDDLECGSAADGQPRGYEKEGGTTGMRAHLLRCQTASEVLRHARGKEPGTVPAGLLRWAQELLEPKVDWRKALAAEIRAGIYSVSGMVDYSYGRPSRRQSVSADVVLPSLRKPLPQVAVVCDTSGSMSESLLGQAFAEVEGLLRSVGLSRDGVRVLSCDAAVHDVRRVTSVRQVELFGGGGTNMGEGIDVASRLKPKPGVIVVLTDGYTPWPSDAPKGSHVIAGLLGADAPEAPPWARAIRIEDAA